MGDLRPDGNGTPPDDGGSHRDELPEFPPEWGPVIIPDDASELEDEAQALRRELRRHARQTSLRSALGMRPRPQVHLTHASSRRHESSPLGVSAVIMAVAMLTTLISLFVVVWGNQTEGPTPQSSPHAQVPTPATTNVSDTSPASIADVVLHDASGQAVRLGSLLPAVVLLVDRCDCATLVPRVAAAAPPGVTVIPVAMTVTATNVTNIHALADPNSILRNRLTDPSHPTSPAAVAVLLDRTGTVVATRNSVLTAEEIAPDVAKLSA